MTNPAQSLLSEDDVAAAHAVGATAATEFTASLAELRALLRSGDQVEVLARAGIQATLAQRPHKRTAKAVDLQIFHVELLQALCLAEARQEDAGSADFPELASSAMALIDRNQRAYRDMTQTRVSSYS